jgi:catechol 2,3-dioxygenase-like lactoylglutathione lyase family enzyme
MTMTLYTTVGVSDLARSVSFYDAVFATLGYRQSKGRTAASSDGGRATTTASASGSASRSMASRRRRATVDGCVPRTQLGRGEGAFHTAALAHGGSDEGAPGTREIWPEFYVAYVRDPDGNKLACVFHRYDASKDR